MTQHLIHVGYPKTGSNFLRQWFSTHPQLAYAEGGIAGWHDVHQISAQAAQPLHEILYRVTSSEGLAAPHASIGQLTMDYARVDYTGAPATQARVAGVLAQQFPNARILVVTRGFRSMILSAYSQIIRIGGSVDFAEFCSSLRSAAARDADGWNYSRLLNLYIGHFGAANVLAMPYELMRDELESFTDSLERWLGLVRGPVARERLNVSLSAVELAWYLRLTQSMQALPLPRLQRKLMRSYLRAVMQNRLRDVIPMLQKLLPLTPITAESLSAATVECFRGHADTLRHDPLYARYSEEYLFT